MAYKALYRSYRPQKFEELAGQTHIVKTIQNAVKQNKISHAYLFCGPRGTGKTTVAKLLAKAVNCTSTDIIPCDQCNSCISIANGTHQDIIEIDAASNNGVDEVRDLIEKVKYSPIEGKYKVYIIDEVHMMSQGAFNALLKTLEEPPAHVIFILATTEPQKILPTIISRCQRFDFNKISKKDIVARLQDIINSENLIVEKECLELVASLADGGMRDALSILEQCLAYSNTVTVEDINQIYGIVSHQQKIDYLLNLINKNIVSVISSIDTMFQSGIDIKRLTTDLIDILKDIVIYKNTNDVNNLFVIGNDEIKQIAPYVTIDEIFNYIDIFIEADQQYKFASNIKLYFELASLKICNNVQEEVVNVSHETFIAKPPTKTINDTNSVIKSEQVIINQTDNSESITNIDQNDNNLDYQNNDHNNIEETQQIIEETYNEPIVEEYDQINDISQISNNYIEIDTNDIMNILVQANRKILVSIQEKWGIIKKYQYNLNMAKFALMLCDGEVVAACNGAMIIAFEYEPNVNQINYGEYYNQLKSFIREIFNEDYDLVAILKDDWLIRRNEFIKLKRENLLPTPKPINLKHISHIEIVEEDKLTEAQKFGMEVFGDIVEFKGE